MSARHDEDAARTYVRDLTARVAEQTARNRATGEFLDWIQAMLLAGFLIVPAVIYCAGAIWLTIADWSIVLNLAGLGLVLASPFAGIGVTAAVIYFLGGPCSPNHRRPRP